MPDVFSKNETGGALVNLKLKITVLKLIRVGVRARFLLSRYNRTLGLKPVDESCFVNNRVLGLPQKLIIMYNLIKQFTNSG